jgi:hypothetical protein
MGFHMKNGARIWVALMALVAGGPAVAAEPATSSPSTPAAKAAAPAKAAALPQTAAARAGAAAPTPAGDITGTWQGKLKVDPNTAITIQFIFARKPDGTYTATLNSPDNGAIKNVAASAVAVSGATVSLQAPSLSGAYSGTLKGDSIDGKWTQPGGTLPLVLTPYAKPQLSKADIDTLLGSWHGPVTFQGGSFTFVVRFKSNDKGELQGSLTVAEQGGAELPMSDLEFANGKLAFKIPPVQGEYTASYANGVFTGAWKQSAPGMPPAGLPLTLKKGEYAAPVYVLKLSAESFVALSGTWQGALQVTTPQGQQISLPLVLRFETNEQALIVGFIDSPSQHAVGIPVTDANLAAGKLVLKVGSLNAEYHADLSGRTLAGKWTQGPLSNPLTLTKK